MSCNLQDVTDGQKFGEEENQEKKGEEEDKKEETKEEKEEGLSYKNTGEGWANSRNIQEPTIKGRKILSLEKKQERKKKYFPCSDFLEHPVYKQYKGIQSGKTSCAYVCLFICIIVLRSFLLLQGIH